jgi:CBS domain-containing protein
MKVEDIMCKDLIVGYVPGTVENVLKILAEHNISGIPILKKGTEKLVGIVTREDIFKNADEDQLAMIVNENYFSINKDQDVTEAAKIFYDNRIHGLPVVGKNNSLVGILSPSEILKVIIEKKISDIAKDHISKIVIPVYMDTPIDIIMEIINITNEDALAVLNENRKLVGIVTDGDIFKLHEFKEGLEQSSIGLGDDEDQWTWEGIRDTVRMYHATSEVSLPKIPVKEVMVKDVKTATNSTPVLDIAKLMIKNKISHVPIVDSEHRLIGIISDIDLMHCILPAT